MSGATGVPDLLSLARLSRANHDLKRQLQDAQTELITGEAADKVAATNGDPLRLLALDNEIAAIDSRLPLISMAKTRAGATETALGNAQDAVGDFGVRLLGFTTAKDSLSARAVAKDAETILSQVVSALNVQVSGRHVFGGDDAAHAPMAPAEALIRDVRALVAGELQSTGASPGELEIYQGSTPPALTTRPATPEEQIAHYFGAEIEGQASPEIADPVLGDTDAANAGKLTLPADARFSTATDGEYADLAERSVIYRGGQGDAPEVELAADARLSYSVRGDDPKIRDLLFSLARVAVAADEADPSAMLADLQSAAEGLIAAQDGMTELRAEVGQNQARIENAEARAQAERSSFVQARNALVGRDPYEAATRITELETQLQSVYAMTARLSNLSLLNFLR